MLTITLIIESINVQTMKNWKTNACDLVRTIVLVVLCLQNNVQPSKNNFKEYLYVRVELFKSKTNKEINFSWIEGIGARHCRRRWTRRPKPPLVPSKARWFPRPIDCLARFREQYFRGLVSWFLPYSILMSLMPFYPIFFPLYSQVSLHTKIP